MFVLCFLLGEYGKNGWFSQFKKQQRYSPTQVSNKYIKLIQELLGHNDIKTTLHYAQHEQ